MTGANNAIFAKSKPEIQQCRERLTECAMTSKGPKADEAIIECVKKERL
jgi:hypothetical protein